MNRRTCLFIVILLIVVLVYLLPGCDKLVTEVTEITIAGHPSAGFRAWPTSCCAPCTVYFQDTSIGPIQVWIWDFGDDSVDTFVGTVPDTIPHVYTTGGVHDVSLTVLDTTVPDTGFDTEVEHRYISIGVIPAEFAVIPDSVCPGGEITFWPPTGTIYR
ncbi:MAG: PKD domain-containing protein, partial [Candidatus Zixiibacteriota bacterium]